MKRRSFFSLFGGLTLAAALPAHTEAGASVSLAPQPLTHAAAVNRIYLGVGCVSHDGPSYGEPLEVHRAAAAAIHGRTLRTIELFGAAL